MLAFKRVNLEKAIKHVQPGRRLLFAANIINKFTGKSSFNNRIKSRHTAFWTANNTETIKKAINYATDPLAKWKDDNLWQRKLSNKFNAREFAKLHGCKIPKLYWKGRDISTINFDALPRHYVIKPTTGHSCQSVFLMDQSFNLMDGQIYNTHKVLKALDKALEEDIDLEFMIENLLEQKITNTKFLLITNFICLTAR